MPDRLRTVAVFIASAVLMAVAGTVAQTQFVLSALGAVGAPISLADRLAMTGADLLGFAPLYAILIATCFAIAFSAAGLLLRWVRLPHVLVFAVAGAASIALMLVLMRAAFFGVPLIAGARSTAGFLVQMACGGLAGTLFGVVAGHLPAQNRR